MACIRMCRNIYVIIEYENTLHKRLEMLQKLNNEQTIWEPARTGERAVVTENEGNKSFDELPEKTVGDNHKPISIVDMKIPAQ